MSEGRQTVAGAYLKLAAHEELCAERYRGINEKLSWVLRSLVGMLLALLAWALVQLYALEPLRREAAPAYRHSAGSLPSLHRKDVEGAGKGAGRPRPGIFVKAVGLGAYSHFAGLCEEVDGLPGGSASGEATGVF